MCEGSHGCLAIRRENFVKFLGEEKMVGVDEASERLSVVVSTLVFGCRAVVI